MTRFDWFWGFCAGVCCMAALEFLVWHKSGRPQP